MRCTMFECMVITERNLLEIFFPITKGLPPRVIISFQLIKKEPSKIECNSDFLFFFFWFCLSATGQDVQLLPIGCRF